MALRQKIMIPVLTLVLLCLAAGPTAAAGVKVTGIKAAQEGVQLIVSVDLSARLTPKVKGYGIKTKKPRVVVDFNGASGVKSLPSLIRPESPLAKTIRIGVHKSPAAKVRLVIDLVPGRLYTVKQWFRKDINRYLLVLSAQ